LVGAGVAAGAAAAGGAAAAKIHATMMKQKNHFSNDE